MILQEIQNALKVPKSQENKFGGYKYRSCEDILEALKPVLAGHNAAVVITDEITETAGRVYVKATATLVTPDGDVSACAFARESAERKGMDPAQITGAASSYARKYALNGLFAIDDTKDPDAQEPQAQAPKTQQETASKSERLISDHIVKINASLTTEALKNACAEIRADLGPNFEKYKNNILQHYNRRLAEIVKEQEGMQP